ncbi:hypothetical protein PQX77_019570 [Marasmius sp. AFHP31]|nr:hypothetical protein PQX77_019570 [Marasmius sp. AFHP31]
MDEASTTPQPIFKRLGLIVVIRGTFLTLVQLLLVILVFALPNQLGWTTIHQALPFLYYTTAISTLNIRLELLERPGMDEESENDSVSEPGIHTKVPTPAAGDLFMDYTNRVPRPGPALDAPPVVVESREIGGFRPGQRVDTKEIHLEWTPPQDEPEASPPAIQNPSHPPTLTPNRLNQDINLSSEFTPSKVYPRLPQRHRVDNITTAQEGESTVSVAENGTDAYHRPRVSRPLVEVLLPSNSF